MPWFDVNFIGEVLCGWCFMTENDSLGFKGMINGEIALENF